MLKKAPVLEFSTTDKNYLVIDKTYFQNYICFGSLLKFPFEASPSFVE